MWAAERGATKRMGARTCGRSGATLERRQRRGGAICTTVQFSSATTRTCAWPKNGRSSTTSVSSGSSAWRERRSGLPGSKTARDSGRRHLLDGVGRVPQRAWIHAIGIKFQHGIVELACARRRLGQVIEILEVFPRLPDVAGSIVVSRHLVPGDHGPRLERLELGESGDPFKPARFVGLAEKGMNSVVHGI